MKAIILAAGRGRRLSELGWEKPKCLLEFGGTTLLDNIILALRDNGIDRVVTVVGYERDLVTKAIAQHPIHCEIIVNDAYATTNTINSLWLTRDLINEDFLYFNSDVLFDRRIIARLIAASDSPLAVDVKHCGAEEVKVLSDTAGRITRIGKALDPADAQGEFIGIGKFAWSACPDLVAALRKYNEVEGKTNLFFEAAVDDILPDHRFVSLPLGNLQAIEIDTPADLRRAAALQWDGQKGQSSRPGPAQR